MTYIVAKYRTIGGKRYGPYLHEVDSVRTGDTVKQVHIKYIGQPGGTNFASSFNVTNPDELKKYMNGETVRWKTHGEGTEGDTIESDSVASSYGHWFSRDWKEMRKADEFKNKKEYVEYRVRMERANVKRWNPKASEEALKRQDKDIRFKAGYLYDESERVKAGANYAPVYEGNMVRITQSDYTHLEKGDTYQLRSMASFAQPGTTYSSTFESTVIVVRNGKGRIISKVDQAMTSELELLVSKGTKFHVQKVTKNVSGKELMNHLKSPGRDYRNKMNVIELVQLEGGKK
tara:strand:- start:1122 stop:1988 length:867 start_codon:yes stop_codon:yes gene_type:complete